MAAAVGTIVHGSIEDIIGENLTGRDPKESGWMPTLANKVLRERWEEEKEIFFKTPRHPEWKDSEWDNAKTQQYGGIELLLTKVGASGLDVEAITIELWRQVQRIILSCEGELRSTDGRLMGRMDLLLAKFDDKGDIVGWVVADLKTGKVPTGALKPNVSRQLRFYRDLLKQNNPDHPTVVAEGWYSANQTVHQADGPDVLESALEAWEGMRPSTTPLPATPGDQQCGWCEWKAWCPIWWAARRDGTLSPGHMFRDEVVQVIRFDREAGAALFQRMPPIGNEGELAPSDHKFGAVLRDQALVHLSELLDSGHEGAIFLGSARMDGRIAHLGDWCEILPWNPMNEGHARDYSRWLRSNSDTVFGEIGEDGEDNQSK